MDKYDRYGRIPKNTRVGMTIFMVSIVDIAVVGGLGFIALKLSEKLAFSPLFALLNILVAVILGLALVIRTPAAPKTRNTRVIYSVLKMDRKKYFPVRLEEGRKQK